MRQMTDGSIQISLLGNKDDILDALIYLGSSLFDQSVNTRKKQEELSVKYSKYANVLVLSLNNQIIGLCVYYDNDPDGNSAYISMLVVDKRYQGKGYGKVLLHEAHKRCTNKQMERIFLTVSKDNRRAIELYDSMGYSTVSADDGNLVLQKALYTQTKRRDLK